MEYYLEGQPNVNATLEHKMNINEELVIADKFHLWYKGIELRNTNPHKGTINLTTALTACKNYHQGNPPFPDGSIPFGLVVKINNKYFIFTSNTGVNASRIRKKINRSIN